MKTAGVYIRALIKQVRMRVTSDRMAYLLILFTLAMGAMTAYVLASVGYVSGDTDLLVFLLSIDVLALGVLALLVGRQFWRLWLERRRRLAGHQLHWRLALLFGRVTTLPAIIITLFALFVVDYSLRGWFAERISTAVNESVTVAEAYFEEHARSISVASLAMANDVNREAYRLAGNNAQMNRYLSNQAGLRNLSDAIIFDGSGKILAKSRFAFAITFADLDSAWLEQARGGEVVVLRVDDTNKLRAVIKLISFVDAYLLVGRFIDIKVLDAMDSTRLAAADYQQLGFKQLDLQVSFAALFGFILLLLLITALWIGLSLANAIVGPLGAVIYVAEQVRSGNLSQRVPENLKVDEIARLGASFNRMLDELARSREQLVQANHQLDQRREFTEAVLGGVSSGVIGLDKNGKVTLPNASARSLLGMSDQQLIGCKFIEVVPEFTRLMAMKNQSKHRFVEDQITLTNVSRRTILRARLVSEVIEERIIGFVVTFDDVTDLLSAQRKAAWSDIARRIAHEIKNPLTPIQLASDRLRKKFKPSSEVDALRFEEYVDIITRQVGDIGRMVDEFSAFARMPQPVLEPVSLYDLASGQLKLFEAQKIPLLLEVDNENSDYLIVCDSGLIRQAITNLLQNAQESLLEHHVKSPKITLRIQEKQDETVLIVSDNGPGFPDMDFSQLIEPYVTTRQKGTGLGLAIVSKIIDDHGGRMELQCGIPNGAIIELWFSSYKTYVTKKG